MTTPHPAKFSKPVLDAIDAYLPPEAVDVLDPFAGVGGVHTLREYRPGLRTVGVEIEPEWAEAHPDTIVGDALTLPFFDQMFDAIVTSPCYGNRMADQYVPPASDTSSRYTYRLSLGRSLTEGSAASMQWGATYRDFHARAWGHAVRVLRPGGTFLLNISDHVRNGITEPVSAWHIFNLTFEHGLVLKSLHEVDTARMLHSPNRARASSEFLAVLQKAC